MDHVINSLREWIEVYKEDSEAERDEKAIKCIENAIKELNKYYSNVQR